MNLLSGSDDLNENKIDEQEANLKGSEASSPKKCPFLAHLLRDSSMSPHHFLGAQTSSQDSKNLMAYLDQAANAKSLLAYDGYKAVEEELKASNKFYNFIDFQDNVEQANFCNKKYQFEQIKDFIADAKEQKKRITLDEEKAHSFQLYYHIKGRVYLYERKFRKCLKALKKALDIVEKYPDEDRWYKFDISNDIAKVHYTLRDGDYQEAKNLLEQSLEYSEEKNDIELKTLCFFQLAELYIILHDVENAEKNIKLCEQAASRIPSGQLRTCFLGRNKRNEGSLHFISGEENEGIDCYEKALDILTEIFSESNTLIRIYQYELQDFKPENKYFL